MKLTIDGGRWIVMSDDARVHIQIHPRRSIDSDPTRMLVRSEPMPLRVYEPELLSGEDAHAAAWVWDATPEHARALALRMLETLRSNFQGQPADTPIGRWRMEVLNSLWPAMRGEGRQGADSQRA